MAKLLIYGFKPWGKNNKNISEEVIKELQKFDYLTTEVLQVRFEKAKFINMFKKRDIKFVLGLGQARKGSKLRIEKFAYNEYRQNGELKQIKHNGDKRLNLEIYSFGEEFVISTNPGRFVCNFGMYIVEDYCRLNNMKSSFIHIPSNYNLKNAVKIISKYLVSINKSINY